MQATCEQTLRVTYENVHVRVSRYISLNNLGTFWNGLAVCAMFSFDVRDARKLCTTFAKWNEERNCMQQRRKIVDNLN